MKKIVLVVICFWTGGACAQEAPSYSRHIRPLFGRYCLECHNAKSPKGGLDLESYKALLEGGNKGDVLSPGDPNDSRLVTLVEGKEKPIMPPKSAKHRPKAAEIALLRAWVKAGAKDDGGSIKVVLPQIKSRVPDAAPVTALAFDPQGRYLVAGRNHEVIVHCLNAKAPKFGFKEIGRVSALGYSADGDLLAIASGVPGAEGRVAVYPGLKSGASAIAQVAKPHVDVILALAISPDKKWLATASYDTRVCLTPLNADKGDARKPVILKDHSDGVYGVAFSPDSKRVATCSADRAVKVWEVATGTLLLTLSEANDWLYALDWSADGAYLAAGGLDRSIRLYAMKGGKAKLLHSVFAHEGGIQKLLFSRDGSKLYSLGLEGVTKIWKTAGMVEMRLIERQPVNVQCIAISPDDKQIALGRYDGVVVLIDEATGKKVKEFTPAAQPTPAPSSNGKAAGKGKATGKGKTAGKAKEMTKTEPKDPFPVQKDSAGNDSPSRAALVKLPASIHGVLDRAGDIDFFRFDVKKGQQLGIQVVAAAIGSKVDPFLQLLDAEGKVVAESADGLLGHTFSDAGAYVVGIRDRELKGGAGMAYRLNLGPIPIVTAIFPLGLQGGQEMEFSIQGVFLDQTRVKLKAAADAAPGTRLMLPVASKLGKVHGQTQVVVGEFAETLEDGKIASLGFPGTGNGILLKTDESDVWRFAAKKGRRVVVEVEARRLGSPLDSVIEVHDVKGAPVERAVLRCQAKTFVTFRDHDNVQGNIRIEAWNDLGINDYIFAGSELIKIVALPTHPDADCNFFTAGGLRTGYLDTTPTHQANNEPMYKVTVHPPGTKFPPNGFPVFTLNYRNDDGGPGYGRDSKLIFDPPQDGEYRVRVRDARGEGSSEHAYRLTVRSPRPGFNVRFSPDGPAVWRGGAIPINVTADRVDGYDGPIQIRLQNLPPGFHAPSTDIAAGLTTTAFALFADADAKVPTKAMPLKLIAEAVIDGKKVTKETFGTAAKLVDPGDIVTRSNESEVTLVPGGITTLTVNIERRDKFAGRVPLDVRGLPHGVRVLDIGLNGILVNESETRRTIQIYAEPWVEATEHPIVVLARREGKNTEHGAKSVLLKIAK